VNDIEKAPHEVGSGTLPHDQRKRMAQTVPLKAAFAIGGQARDFVLILLRSLG